MTIQPDVRIVQDDGQGGDLVVRVFEYRRFQRILASSLVAFCAVAVFVGTWIVLFPRRDGPLPGVCVLALFGPGGLGILTLIINGIEVRLSKDWLEWQRHPMRVFGRTLVELQTIDSIAAVPRGGNQGSFDVLVRSQVDGKPVEQTIGQFNAWVDAERLAAVLSERLLLLRR